MTLTCERSRGSLASMAGFYDATYVTAFPTDPGARAKVERLAGMSLPPPSDPDVQPLPCDGCGMELEVGPKSRALIKAGLQLLCLFCVMGVLDRRDDIDLLTVDKPE